MIHADVSQHDFKVYNMKALVYQDESGTLRFRDDHPEPLPGADEALIRVLRAGVCSTDLEITRGYVPDFNHVLGHEFVGVVEQCSSQPDLIGKRVVGEINCNICNFTCADAVFQRNHAPGRTVLGIIGKDGCMAQRVTLPARNLHVVPEALTDQQACYCEPVAAACRILEQKCIPAGSKVAVIGDGKLGLLVAAVLIAAQDYKVTLLGRHTAKMQLVKGCAQLHVVSDAVQAELGGQFDGVVEASGSSQGIRLALGLLRPMGTLVLKSTVSLKDPAMPGWSEIANDLVVNEKVLVGSRCGPMDVALRMMERHKDLQDLLDNMTTKVLPLSQGEDAMKLAATKGTLKVQLDCTL